MLKSLIAIWPVSIAIVFDGVIVQVDEKRRQADLARQQYKQMMEEQR